jgi:hypothetical protein
MNSEFVIHQSSFPQVREGGGGWVAAGFDEGAAQKQAIACIEA